MTKYLVEIIQDGNTFEVLFKELVNPLWVTIDHLSLTDFNSILEAEHYVKNVPLKDHEKIINVMVYDEERPSGKQHFELVTALRELGRAVPIEEIQNQHETAETDPIIQIREFHDGTYSVAARVYTPEKNFYEHPEFINLTKEEAEAKCQKVIAQNLKNADIVTTWLHYGN